MVADVLLVGLPVVIALFKDIDRAEHALRGVQRIAAGTDGGERHLVRAGFPCRLCDHRNAAQKVSELSRDLRGEGDFKGIVSGGVVVGDRRPGGGVLPVLDVKVDGEDHVGGGQMVAGAVGNVIEKLDGVSAVALVLIAFREQRVELLFRVLEKERFVEHHALGLCAGGAGAAGVERADVVQNADRELHGALGVQSCLNVALVRLQLAAAGEFVAGAGVRCIGRRRYGAGLVSAGGEQGQCEEHCKDERRDLGVLGLHFGSSCFHSSPGNAGALFRFRTSFLSK